MARRRMFSTQVVESDAFTNMPLSAQSLYFHLSMSADDDGFVNNPSTVQRMINASDEDMKALCNKGFLLIFDSGIVAIKHWRINNYIQKDRYHSTAYVEEKQKIEVKENGSYTLIKNDQKSEVSSANSENCIQSVSKMDTEVRLGKSSLDKTQEEAACAREESVFEYYEDNFGIISQPEMQGLMSLQEELKPEVIKYGIDQAVLAGVKKFSYLRGICMDWERAGVKSKQDAEHQVEEFEKRKKTKPKRGYRFVYELPEYIKNPQPIDNTPASEQEIEEAKRMLEQMRGGNRA